MTEPSRGFSRDILNLLEETEEVQIEPRLPDGRHTQAVTIWIAVDGSDVYVRSARGANGRWYQALVTNPQGVLHVDDREIPFRAAHVDNRETIDRASQAYQRKYGRRWPNETAGMLRDEVLNTTLRLVP